MYFYIPLQLKSELFYFIMYKLLLFNELKILSKQKKSVRM